ncbi:MAG: type II toxin-antitoxin system VapC family toxin [Chloroflexota bacterium]
MFVVDASVTLTWCFEDETTEATQALLRRLFVEGGLAPGHWPVEVANGLWSAERRGRLAPGKLTAARTVLGTIPVDIVPMTLAEALGSLDVARAHDLTAYDAAYLDLARSRGLGLATADHRLAAACRTVGVPLIE